MKEETGGKERKKEGKGKKEDSTSFPFVSFPRAPLSLSLPLSSPTQVNATSFAPITAIQFGANRFYEQALATAGVAPGGVAGTLLAAAAAGATSTVVGNPSELLMIRQQQHRTSLMEEAKAVVRDFGVRGLYRGLVSSKFFFFFSPIWISRRRRNKREEKKRERERKRKKTRSFSLSFLWSAS